MEFTLNERLAPGEPKKFGFVEKEYDHRRGDEAGLTDFLQDSVLCNDPSKEELEFLRRLRFKNRRPNRLFYYRVLQGLRDPLHFLAAEE
jgi:hypothetical protein